MAFDPNTMAKFITIGFSFLGTVDQTGAVVKSTPVTEDGDLWMEFAAREFQRYSRMPFVGKLIVPAPVPQPPPGPNPQNAPVPVPYALTMQAAPNPWITAADVDGNHADPALVTLLDNWIGNGLRIPVIVSAWKLDHGRRNPYGLVAENIWLPKQCIYTLKPGSSKAVKAHRASDRAIAMFVTDYSGHFANAPVGNFVRLGSYFPYTQDARKKPPRPEIPYGGPGAFTEATEAVNFTSLTRLPAPGTPEQESNYRVVEAIARAEVNQFMDECNGYDAAILSSGIFQWTIGVIDDGIVGKGELGGFLALLERSAGTPTGDAFKALVTDMGLDLSHHWTDQTIAGVFDRTARVYRSYFTQKAGADWVRMTDKQDAECFRGWHFFYRFRAATLYLDAYCKAMWVMARVRLRDLAATPWPDDADHIPQITVGGVLRPANVGEVFCSELTMAMIARWHVNLPGAIVNSGEAGPKLQNAVNQLAARAAAAAHPVPLQPVDKWTSEEQRLLALFLKNSAPRVKDKKTHQLKDSDIRRDLGNIMLGEYGDPSTALSDDPSFTVDESELPKAPPPQVAD